MQEKVTEAMSAQVTAEAMAESERLRARDLEVCVGVGVSCLLSLTLPFAVSCAALMCKISSTH